MSHTGPAGAQQYSDEELAPISTRPTGTGRGAAHAHGDEGIRAAIEAGIDCIEHGSLMSDETLDLLVERGGSWCPRPTWPTAWTSRLPPPSSKPRRPRCSPGPSRPSEGHRRGVRIACGTDAPAIPHGRNAKELLALVDPGMTPLQALRAATTVAAELIDATTAAGWRPGGWPTGGGARRPPGRHHGHRGGRFVMKGGLIYRNDVG